MRRLAVTVATGLCLLACSSDEDPPEVVRGLVDPSDAAVVNDAQTQQADASVDGDADGGTTFQGEATYYDADGSGACGFPKSPNDLNVAAMNKAQYEKSVCGRCALVDGSNGSVKVRIVDLCPGCKQGDLDLSREAFGVLAKLSAGRVKIRWRFVPC